MNKDKGKKDRDIYGKVESPISLVQEMYSLLSLHPGLRVYEPGVGTEVFRKYYHRHREPFLSVNIFLVACIIW